MYTERLPYTSNLLYTEKHYKDFRRVQIVFEVDESEWLLGRGQTTLLEIETTWVPLVPGPWSLAGLSLRPQVPKRGLRFREY